ncbi:hypothetical protein HDU67_003861 [Dinochytrium kinnereticum]|nr:hypothetical protein HDU67_003861 [Dinochytrium kinnereticum]
MLIAVTGGTGYIGAHVVNLLLENPTYNVLTTVRSLPKADFLKSLPNAADRLKIVEADLNRPESFRFDGVDVVIHVASPMHIQTRDPQKEVVEPAVNGTLAVLEAAKRAGSVRTVVITSSMAAITDDPQPGKVLTEADWNSTSSLTRNPYYYSKRCSEKAAWDWEKANPGCFKIVTVNPSIVIGPSLSKNLSESVGFIKGICTAEFPVDVRDVAKTHLLAFETPTSSGRYICHGEAWTMSQTCDFIQESHPSWKIAKKVAPNWLMWLMSFTMGTGTGSYIRTNMGQSGFELRTEKACRELGVGFRSVGESVEDTIQDLQKWGHINIAH